MLFIPSFLSKTRRTFPREGILPTFTPQNKSFSRSDTRSGTLHLTDVSAGVSLTKLALKSAHGGALFIPALPKASQNCCVLLAIGLTSPNPKGHAIKTHGLMYPCCVGLCTHDLRAYAPMTYGFVHPYCTGLCTHYGAPVVYGTTVSSLAKRPAFTALRGLPPPECLERTSM